MVWYFMSILYLENIININKLTLTNFAITAILSAPSLRLWWRDKGQRFVLTTLDSQQSIDLELRVSGRSA